MKAKKKLNKIKSFLSNKRKKVQEIPIKSINYYKIVFLTIIEGIFTFLIRDTLLIHNLTHNRCNLHFSVFCFI